MQATSTPSSLPFLKMHGLGNDFVIIDSRGQEPRVHAALARAVGDRNFGVGFDQLAEILDSDDADVRIDFWNTDGSRAGACGNATRCVAALLLDESNASSLAIRTERGLLSAQRDGALISVNMGHAQRDWRDIPLARDVDVNHLPLEGDPVAVGMGNPHAVFFVDSLDGLDVATKGALVEVDPLFPERTNVEFARVRSRNDIRMRVWERGAGITLACGSGACATAVAAVARGLCDTRVSIEVDGGTLMVEVREDGVWLTGPTALVFASELSEQFLASV